MEQDPYTPYDLLSACGASIANFMYLLAYHSAYLCGCDELHVEYQMVDKASGPDSLANLDDDYETNDYETDFDEITVFEPK